jgi:hypothetical protein
MLYRQGVVFRNGFVFWKRHCFVETALFFRQGIAFLKRRCVLEKALRGEDGDDDVRDLRYESVHPFEFCFTVLIDSSINCLKWSNIRLAVPGHPGNQEGFSSFLPVWKGGNALNRFQHFPAHVSCKNHQTSPVSGWMSWEFRHLRSNFCHKNLCFAPPADLFQYPSVFAWKHLIIQENFGSACKEKLWRSKPSKSALSMEP